MKNTEKRNLEYLQLLESLEVMLMNGNSINPNSVIRSAIQVAIGKDVNLNQNKMKQTAVEWFAKQVLRSRQLGFISNEKFNELLEQAKEMDKEQKIEFANNYGFDICGYDYEKAEQYYNTTFKSE